MNHPKELCRIKKAVKAIIRQHREGITYMDICRTMQQQNLFSGTYRNLLSQSTAVLGLLIEEGSIRVTGEGTSKIFTYGE